MPHRDSSKSVLSSTPPRSVAKQSITTQPTVRSPPKDSGPGSLRKEAAISTPKKDAAGIGKKDVTSTSKYKILAGVKPTRDEGAPKAGRAVELPGATPQAKTPKKVECTSEKRVEYKPKQGLGESKPVFKASPTKAGSNTPPKPGSKKVEYKPTGVFDYKVEEETPGKMDNKPPAQDEPESPWPPRLPISPTLLAPKHAHAPRPSFASRYRAPRSGFPPRRGERHVVWGVF